MRRAVVSLLWVGISSGCVYTAYSPGELGEGARSYGCLDLLVRPVESNETPPGGQMIAFDIGNRCDHGVPIDLTAMRVHMRREGTRTAIIAHPYDPRSEIRPARIPASLWIHERIIFFPSDYGCQSPVEHTCVDLQGIVPEAEGNTEFCWGTP